MAKRAVSNPLALAVLACLWEKPMYPYEMTTTMRERGKEDSIRLNFGSLYAVIKSLEKHGFIRVAQTEREGNRPERVVYEITEAGRAEADGWMRELIAVPVKEYPAIETGLSLLPMLAPEVAAELLERRRDLLDAELAERAGEYERALALPLPELFMIESRYRVAIMEAERAFVADLAARIRDRSLGGVDWWERLWELFGQGHDMAEIRDRIAAGDFGREVADLFGTAEAPSPAGT
ncbi:PadR family transcriptional regulator [Leifsonia shinshuensis]|uniref:DNA-binding PadR family transcriptional regulator n=1 Tax=Leifsonia shinshuensis TaxID=150026 RepID=A0A853CY61_9MICO|nr:PadR family transcriptional regulator [Leifsonia shinshuensis]NYJ25537.1 DNA-binding PadR family transcriptional regulator [Leifsonia shinshuensis]